MITPWQCRPSLHSATAEVPSITSTRSYSAASAASRSVIRRPVAGAARVHHAPARVAALEREGEAPIRIAVERDPAALQFLHHPGASRARSSAAERRQASRPAARVSSTCSSGESSGPIAAARPPCAQKLELSESGFRETTATREPASAAVSAE